LSAFPPPLSPVRVKPGVLPLVNASAAAATAAAAAAATGLEYQEPADVAAERRKVEAMQSYANHPIVVKHLQKTYPSRDGQPPKVRKELAVLWLVHTTCLLTLWNAAVWMIAPANVPGCLEWFYCGVGHPVLCDVLTCLLCICPAAFCARPDNDLGIGSAWVCWDPLVLNDVLTCLAVCFLSAACCARPQLGHRARGVLWPAGTQRRWQVHLHEYDGACYSASCLLQQLCWCPALRTIGLWLRTEQLCSRDSMRVCRNAGRVWCCCFVLEHTQALVCINRTRDWVLLQSYGLERLVQSCKYTVALLPLCFCRLA
jgi:hypothetical protein